MGVIALSSGAVLDAAIGPYQGKGTGEHGLFRELTIRDAETTLGLMLADSVLSNQAGSKGATGQQKTGRNRFSAAPLRQYGSKRSSTT